jgi:hypothetical protein
VCLVIGYSIPSALAPVLSPVPTPSTPLSAADELRAATQVVQQAQGRTIPASGPATAGSALRIAGRDVKLPADVFVEAYMISVTCQPGKQCPETPLYSIRRGQSRILISQPNGAVISEEAAPGETAPFQEIKRQLP